MLSVKSSKRTNQARNESGLPPLKGVSLRPTEANEETDEDDVAAVDEDEAADDETDGDDITNEDEETRRDEKTKDERNETMNADRHDATANGTRANENDAKRHETKTTLAAKNSRRQM
jgi:hypothetical protein